MESMKSLYWHSKYGADIEGSFESLKQISEKDISRFKEKNYADNKLLSLFQVMLQKMMLPNRLCTNTRDEHNLVSQLQSTLFVRL